MPVLPIVSAFVLALIGAVAVGLRPGYSFEALLIGATLTAAMVGVAASVLQFVPQRTFLLFAIITGCALGLMVDPTLHAARGLGFGDVRQATSLICPVAAVAALIVSRSAGLALPTLRRRRTANPRS